MDFDFFSCDECVRALYGRDDVRKNIVDTFGENVYTGGKLRKEVLSNLAFSSRSSLDRLESIILPLVESEIRKKVVDPSGNTVFEIPLLYERDLDSRMDRNILVCCNPSICRERAKRRGFTESDYRLRSRFQWDDAEKKRKNPLIVRNEGSLWELDREVRRIAAGLMEPRDEDA
jgi:dephospho-CoA kinase